MDANETRKFRARALRYKKAMLDGLNFSGIVQELYDMSEQCQDVKWFESDDDTLLNALDGDEEQAFEFRMGFSELESEIDELIEVAQYHYESQVSEYFDDFFVGIMQGGDSHGAFDVIGYDAYEEDYFRLCSYTELGLAESESKKRLMRLTKEEMLRVAGQCFAFLSSYMNVKYKYDCLSAAFDVLNEKNGELIENAKEIEAAYDDWERSDHDPAKEKALDRLVYGLPDRFWIE